MSTQQKRRAIRSVLSYQNDTLQFSEQFPRIRLTQAQVHGKVKRPLQVMKFGGTSVGDASCIRRVIEIVRAASRHSGVVVVVSAMSGVTNKLIEAAVRCAVGVSRPARAILAELRQQHDIAIRALIHPAREGNRIHRKIQELFREGDRLCQETSDLGELTLRARDSISGLGERLVVPIVAVALAERGVATEAIEATELVVTDACHGSAEPQMDLTRERCEARLRSLLQQGIVPVVTGFIGGTSEGVLTTLGRGGSDFSATILGAALHADEVIIWKDVDGVLTADPRLVPDACTIPEISYRKAAALAYFGAKVLHPKTLRDVMPLGIPVWIRNTFAPERPGTKIIPTCTSGDGGVKTLTAMSEVALITISGPAIVGTADVLGRASATIGTVQVNALLISQSSPPSEIRFVVSSAVASRTTEALRHEFAEELAHAELEHITLDPNVAIVTGVGWNTHDKSQFVRRASDAMARSNITTIAIRHDPSRTNLSFVVAPKDVKAALVAIHRELQLGDLNSQRLPITSACCD